MLILLPPSETKRDGGVDGTVFDLDRLSFPRLNRQRRTALASLARLSRNRQNSMVALSLGPRQAFEVERNRGLRHSGVLPAIDRYTGVLFDALDAGGLDPAARDFTLSHVVVHSALFGLIGAADPIPAYRLSHDSRLPDLSLPRLWSTSIAQELADLDRTAHSLVVDLRSEAYVHLGPADDRTSYVHVVTEVPGGTQRALNHFNKKAKGEFARAIAVSGIDHAHPDDLIGWAESNGFMLRYSRLGNGRALELVV